jgi:1-acyl-sn-glycerol-3-phosphate acyltransferase
MRRFLHWLRVGLYFVNFVVLLYVVPVVWRLFGADDDDMGRLLRLAARNTFRIFGISWEIVGGEKLSAKQNYIVIANHRSWLDQPSVILASPRLLHFLGKEHYFRVPILSTTLRLFGCVEVKKGGRSELTESLGERLRQGGSLVVYPEATRSDGDTFLSFRSGAYVLSAQTGTPIAPVYIYGAGDALPRARPFNELQPYPIRVVIGEPFVADPNRVDEAGIAAYRDEFMAEYLKYKPVSEPVKVPRLIGRDVSRRRQRTKRAA